MVSQRKALSQRKLNSFGSMKATINEGIVAKQSCVSKVKDISDALYVLNGKWKFPLIFTLRQNPVRFNEILKLVEGITPKVLAKELRELEINGLIERKVFPTTPATITYEANAYSDTLKNVLYELSKWGEQHREKVKQGIRDLQVAVDKRL